MVGKDGVSFDQIDYIMYHHLFEKNLYSHTLPPLGKIHIYTLVKRKRKRKLKATNKV